MIGLGVSICVCVCVCTKKCNRELNYSNKLVENSKDSSSSPDSAVLP